MLSGRSRGEHTHAVPNVTRGVPKDVDTRLVADLAARLRARLRNRRIDYGGLATAVEGVLDLHSVDARYAATGLSICQECGKHWPCPTLDPIVEALDATVSGPVR